MMAERKAKMQDDKEKIEDINEVSGKVTELVNILETEQAQNSKLKAIVFVKDRSVATYLKKILDFMFAKKMNNNNESLTQLFHSSMNNPEGH